MTNLTDQFLQMTFLKSKIETAHDGSLFRIETRRDERTGLIRTRRSPCPVNCPRNPQEKRT